MSNHRRQTPTRQGSFVQRMGSISRSLSFTSRKQKLTSKQELDEENVFCSDIVSQEYIMDKLKGIKYDRKIVKLEVEDLLISKSHHSFLPVVKSLLLSEDKRIWKHVKFMDSIDSSDFVWWVGMKHMLMCEYETIDEDEVDYACLVTFQANVKVPKGAKRGEVVSLLRAIQRDEDLLDLTFGGSLFGYGDDAIPEALAERLDEEGCLKDSFVINVKCGWHKKDGTRAGDWSDLLEFCIKVMRGLLVDDGDLLSAPRGSNRVTRSDCNKPGRKPIRRTKSADTPALLRGGKLRRSMSGLPSQCGAGHSAASATRVPVRRTSSFETKTLTLEQRQELIHRTEAGEPQQRRMSLIIKRSANTKRRSTMPHATKTAEEKASTTKRRSTMPHAVKTEEENVISITKSRSTMPEKSENLPLKSKRRGTLTSTNGQTHADKLEDSDNSMMRPQRLLVAARTAPTRTRVRRTDSASHSKPTTLAQKTKKDDHIDPDYDWSAGAYMDESMNESMHNDRVPCAAY